MRHYYNYGIIGNCAYLALIDDTANVNWLCWPQFDSSFIFGSLLDNEKGGHFSIFPGYEGNYSVNQDYIENTNVLYTDFEAEDGSFRVIDFAPRFPQYDRYFKPNMLVRKIQPIKGTPVVHVSCKPVGKYGELKPEVYYGSSHIRYLNLESQLRLTTNIPLNFVIHEKNFILTEPKYLILTWGIPLEASLEYTAEDFLIKTIDYWQRWVKSTSIGNYFQKEIIRSALTLKIHQYEQTGAIIASATTSLPEAPHSTRNWDYRYCWMRDAYYTLTAFNNVGHFEELEKYFHYIINVALNEKKRLQPLYSINGDAILTEKILDLEGYLGNKPVRIGNQAYEHIQNDVYGQVLVSLLPLYADKRFIDRERSDSLVIVNKLLEKIDETMDEPDAGLWEFRDKSQRHGYTYLFHWAGTKAAMKIAKNLSNNTDMYEYANKLNKQAENYIEKCYDPERGVYTQALESSNLDASMLQLITMNYLDPSSERAKKHLEELEKELKTSEGLFFRYKHEDDFGEPESTFLICSFWYVEALAQVGRIEEAKSLFQELHQYTNHLGLFSEDVEASTGSQWGNCPQAYSHVGHVNAAYRIMKKLDMPNFL